MNTYSKIGKEIFERIPASKTPYWGSLLLAEIKQLQLEEPNEISALRELIKSNEWNKAHDQFSKIRNLTLNNSDKQKELYLLLAENISKITYNQTDTNARFDSDSGYWIYQLVLKIVQSTDSIKNVERIDGILKLFETENHIKNYFAVETSQTFEDLRTKIFNNEEEEYVQLRSELPLNCEIQDLKVANPKSIMYKDSEMWPDGSFEFQFDIKLNENKIGYYALIWDPELELMDEFYVTQ